MPKRSTAPGTLPTTNSSCIRIAVLAYEYLPTNDEHWQTALDAQRQLASTGRHRAVGMADLLIATLANAHDFDVDPL